MPTFWLYLPNLAFLRKRMLVLSVLPAVQSSQPATQLAFTSLVPPFRLGGNQSLASEAYNMIAKPSCLVLPMQRMPWALVCALASAGSNMPAKMAIIAMTTSNSIRVNPLRLMGMLASCFENGVDSSIKILSVWVRPLREHCEL